MASSTPSRSNALLRFATDDPDEFSEGLSGVAPGLHCHSMGPAVHAEVCATMLPDIGMFTSSLRNVRVRSPERLFYGITIPLYGSCEFLVGSKFENYHPMKGHLMLPDRPFDAKTLGDNFKSLQLCFDRASLDRFAMRMREGGEFSPTESLDLARPAFRSFTRHATFIWSELLCRGPIATSPMIAQESAHLLKALLVSAACSDPKDTGKATRRCGSTAVRKAEEYLMANLSNPIAIADVAVAAGTSARTLSREFRRHRDTTIGAFVKQRRLEAANRALLAAEPGETNVTQVALELGFDQLGRFSGEYKKAFGELPSETLAR